MRQAKGENMELVRRMQGMRMDAKRTNARTNSQVICYKCGMRGHMARWCRKPAFPFKRATPTLRVGCGEISIIGRNTLVGKCPTVMLEIRQINSVYN